MDMETFDEFDEKEPLAKAKELQKYEKKWVALVEGKVVASGDTMKETATQAERAGYKEFTFYLVPSSSLSYAPHIWR
jgi:hypothetical protein